MGLIYYRTKDGLADYGFSIERVRDGSVQAFIISQPAYGSRDSDPHKTHRLSEGGRPYVCWDRKLWSEMEAREVAALWADCTQEYIRSGTTF